MQFVIPLNIFHIWRKLPLLAVVLEIRCPFCGASAEHPHGIRWLAISVAPISFY